MKVLKFSAVILSLAQIVSLSYFLSRYQTDNFPFFVFLLLVPSINIIFAFIKK